MEGAKMSKSKGNVVRPHEYVERFGLDAVRYFVFREMVFGQDASFGDEALLTRYNSDLANDLGNLASRTVTMVHRYCGGVVPSPDAAMLVRGPERGLADAANALVATVQAATRGFQLSAALREIWEVIGATNRYIVTREPWKLAKSAASRAELETALYAAADTLRVVAELIRPFMPGTAERMLRMLGIEPSPTSWASLHSGSLMPGTRLGELAALFPRIEHSVEELRDMAADINDIQSRPESEAAAIGTPAAVVSSSPAATAAATAPPPAAIAPAAAESGDRIAIDEFMKVELRVAKVLAAERVKKSTKLLKLQVDTGADQRTIVAGIGESYEPEALIGRSIVVVANLKPAKLMGIESNGMVLAASPEGGKAILLDFEEPPAPGTRVR